MDLESSESEESDVDNGNLYYQVNVQVNVFVDYRLLVLCSSPI